MLLKTFSSFFFFALFILTGIIILLYYFQDRLIYFPRHYSGFYLELSKRLNKIEFQTSEGHQTAFYLPQRDRSLSTSSKLWVFFSGNAALALDWWDFIQDYPEPDTAFLLVDYPGYGFSEGRPSPKSILEASIGAFNALAKSLNSPREDLVLKAGTLGHSLGAAAALNFADHTGIKKVLLISAFTRLKDMAKKIVGSPLYRLTRHNYNNLAVLKRLEGHSPQPQVVIFHGNRDEVIPFEMGKEIKQKFNGLVEFHELDQANHNQILFTHQKLIQSTMIRMDLDINTP
ncbi:MAG: alpha/beta hydrolase [Deltaproteobacteria bacterium]|nr:alpha/beta hydrolase [Deltaproteobacteria bacterium]